MRAARFVLPLPSFALCGCQVLAGIGDREVADDAAVGDAPADGPTSDVAAESSSQDSEIDSNAPTDAGDAADDGDTTTPPDDAGEDADTSTTPVDSGVGTDSSTPLDSGAPTDSASATDSGVAVDSGIDAGDAALSPCMYEGLTTTLSGAVGVNAPSLAYDALSASWAATWRRNSTVVAFSAVDNTGTFLAQDVALANVGSPNAVSDPSITHLGTTAEFAIAYGETVSGTGLVRVRPVTKNGASATTGTASATIAGATSAPEIGGALLSSTTMLVSGRASSTSPTAWFGATFDVAGTPFQAGKVTAGTHLACNTAPAIVNGELVVAFDTSDIGGEFSAFDGSFAAGAPHAFTSDAVETSVGLTYSPSAVAIATDTLAVAFIDRTATPLQIAVAIVTASTNAIHETVPVSASPATGKISPRIAFDATRGTIAVAWVETAGSSDDVFLQELSVSGTSAPVARSAVMCVSCGQGDTFLTWFGLAAGPSGQFGVAYVARTPQDETLVRLSCP